MAVILRLLLSLVLFKCCYAARCAKAARNCGVDRECCQGTLVCEDGKCVSPTTDGGGGDGDSADCPTTLRVDCVSWSVSGGQCQALHWIARVVNQLGDPVNGATVKYDTMTPDGNVVGPNTKATSAGLFSSYVSDLLKYCQNLNDGSIDSEGTIDAVCFQKAREGVYQARILNVTYEQFGCPVVFNETSVTFNYTYPGRGCQNRVS